MKKVLSLSMVFFALGGAQAQQQAIVNGEIKQSERVQKVYLTYSTADEYITDSSSLENHRFDFAIAVAEPTLAILRIKSAPKAGENRPFYEAKQFFLEPGQQTSIVVADSLKNSTITGGAAQSDFEVLQQREKPYEAKMRALNDKYRA